MRLEVHAPSECVRKRVSIDQLLRRPIIEQDYANIIFNTANIEGPSDAKLILPHKVKTQ